MLFWFISVQLMVYINYIYTQFAKETLMHVLRGLHVFNYIAKLYVFKKPWQATHLNKSLSGSWYCQLQQKGQKGHNRTADF